MLALNSEKFLISKFKKRKDAEIKCVKNGYISNRVKKICMKLKEKKKFSCKSNLKKRQQFKKSITDKKNSLD